MTEGSPVAGEPLPFTAAYVRVSNEPVPERSPLQELHDRLQTLLRARLEKIGQLHRIGARDVADTMMADLIAKGF